MKKNLKFFEEETNNKNTKKRQNRYNDYSENKIQIMKNEDEIDVENDKNDEKN